MSFVPEDGTGLANANSYVDTPFADSYFADRGITAWTGDIPTKQTALVRATDYIENRFRFKGDPVFDEASATPQALHFPIVDDNTGLPATMPSKLLKAVCEYALRALTTTLAPDPTTDASGQRVASSMQKVGPLEETTTYVPGGTIFVFKPYPAADMLLRDLIITGRHTVRN